MSNNNSSLLKSSSSAATPLRIADVLLLHLDDDDDQEEQVDGAVFPFSLVMDGCRRRRREAGGFVSRWLTCFRRPEDQHDDDPDDVTNGRDLTSVVAHNDLSGPSGGCRCQGESSFNVGVGCSLLYLIAANKAELDKMMDLRTQMQVLLQNFKEELQVRNASEEGTGSNCHRSSQNLAISHVQPESSTTAIMTFDQSLKCDTPKDVECLEGIDQLQVELEAELERLQLHLEKEKLLQHPEQQSVEVTLKDTASSRSCSMSAGEVIDTVVEAQEAFSEVDCGVPPYELERRLHEVLEARQQEHIRELEAALVCAKHKLSEKEMEISWWRDTARLIAQHVPGPSRCTSDRG